MRSGQGHEASREAGAVKGARELPGLRLLLAGGGTGGHVFPALAVAAAARRRGAEVSFVGSTHGMEARLVPERGIEFHALPARPVLGRGPLGKASAALTLVASTWRARRLAVRLRPDAVLGTGGYVSAAPVLGARMAGKPVVLLEPNAEPGGANRALSRLASGACIAFRDTADQLACVSWLTGVPVRDELFAIADGLPESAETHVLVLGGSQGAQQLNLAVPAAVAALRPPLAALRIVHQCGERHVEATRAAWSAVTTPARVEVVPFLADVPAAMAAAHLVVSRAGAITLAELCAAGRPSLLVPLAIAAGHQEGNAAALERAGAARVLRSGEVTTERLTAELAALLGDRTRLAAMGGAARSLARPGAADAIVDRLAEVAA
jgi:UDP-N-acetylglucosamine--N-acetylmuramyl-(pentapeptide) pyrophosphoryl-undecaprenol N-acetylglucosamine transferase